MSNANKLFLNHKMFNENKLLLNQQNLRIYNICNEHVQFLRFSTLKNSSLKEF